MVSSLSVFAAFAVGDFLVRQARERVLDFGPPGDLRLPTLTMLVPIASGSTAITRALLYRPCIRAEVHRPQARASEKFRAGPGRIPGRRRLRLGHGSQDADHAAALELDEVMAGVGGIPDGFG